MSGLAIGLVLTAAGLHASWNYLAKGAYGGISFVWLYSLIAAVLYAPLIVVLLLSRPITFGAVQLLFVAVSSVLQLVYFLLLTKAYQVADLSLVYPLARGVGPMLATAVAILLLGERPSPLALSGALLIGLGIFVLLGDPRKLHQSGAGRGVLFAVLTGMMIATYTLWDKQAVSVYGIPPLLLDWGANVLRIILMVPLVASRRPAVLREWNDHRRRVIGIAVLAPLAYILVLTALSFSPVSYVAPMRECSVLIGTLMGARLLAEGDTRRRLTGAAVIVGGVIAIGLG